MRKVINWPEMKEFLAEKMGFWKELPVSWEQEKMLRAGNCCRRLMKNVFVRELESVMKSGRSVKHVRIADKVALSSSRHA